MSQSNMRFADSFTQDMDFWRQRVVKEEGRRQKPSSFTSNALAELPRNPFRDSAGMLLGKGVSPRQDDHTALGVLVPDLAAYRSAVTETTRSPSPNSWHLGAQTPYHLSASMSSDAFSPQSRAMRGAERLREPETIDFRAPKQFEKV